MTNLVTRGSVSDIGVLFVQTRSASSLRHPCRPHHARARGARHETCAHLHGGIPVHSAYHRKLPCDRHGHPDHLDGDLYQSTASRGRVSQSDPVPSAVHLSVHHAAGDHRVDNRPFVDLHAARCPAARRPAGPRPAGLRPAVLRPAGLRPAGLRPAAGRRAAVLHGRPHTHCGGARCEASHCHGLVSPAAMQSVLRENHFRWYHVRHGSAQPQPWTLLLPRPPWQHPAAPLPQASGRRRQHGWATGCDAN
eukprot:scaffold10667_cov31-Tisochrysis_lutea.AAC.2